MKIYERRETINDLHEIAKLMREGIAHTKPARGAYARDGRTCAIGAAALALTCKTLAPDEKIQFFRDALDHASHGIWPLGKLHHSAFTITGTLDAVELLPHTPVRGLVSWILSFNDSALASDPTCDPRPFIADCLDELANQIEATL